MVPRNITLTKAPRSRPLLLVCSTFVYVLCITLAAAAVVNTVAYAVPIYHTNSTVLLLFPTLTCDW